MQTCTSVDDALCKRVGLESPDFVARLMPQLIDLVRASRRLPLGEEHAIRRGSREFLSSSKEMGEQLMKTMHTALLFLDASNRRSTRLEEMANFNVIVDSIDNILEGVDASLRSALAGPSAATSRDAPGSANQSFSSASSSQRSTIPKPQVRWRDLIDNVRTQFVPRLLVKHNQKAPLPTQLVEAQCQVGIRSSTSKAGSSGGAARKEAASQQMSAPNALQSHLDAMGVGEQKEASVLPHPYAVELDALTWDESFFDTVKPKYFLRMEDTPLVIVKEEPELRSMVEEIKATCVGKEIAVDVEHHDFRSYRGFVCLVQISTREKDFILDPFNMFAQMHLLNEIFSDPNILKVLHGADRDVLWLQRDFSVYIVNMFDTGLATRTLRLQGGFSLANLVRHFCGVKLDKKYQTADWRERPLPEEMLQYARCDTHYLLYCYDCVKNALLVQNSVSGPVAAGEASDSLQATDTGVQALKVVMEGSTALCRLQHSESPLDSANQAVKLSERFGSKQRPLDSRQFKALQALIEWRDRLARSSDESWNFVSPDTCLWRIVLAMPSCAFRLRSTCNPLPLSLQQRADEVVDIVNRCSDDRVAVGSSPTLASVPAPTQPQRAIALEEQGPQEPAPDVVVVAESSVPAQRPQWPSRTCTAVTPIVHVTVSDGQYSSANQTHAILDTMVDLRDSLGSAGPVNPLLLNNTVECVATKPPVKDVCNVAEAVASTQAQPSGAIDGATDATPPPQLQTLSEPKLSTAGDTERAAPPGSANPSLMPMLSRKKRRRKNARYECLEDVAQSVATDPYASVGVFDSEPQPKILTAPNDSPRKRKKAKCVSEPIFIDPYL